MTTIAPSEKRPANGFFPRLLLPALGATALLIGGCSKSESSSGNQAGGAGASLEIVSCSLGCVPTGSVLNCGPLNIFVNQEISVEFSDEIDIESVTKNSFRMVEAGTGAVPAATFQIDPNNPRRLVYRPSVTFDSQGNPIFGLNEGALYQLTIPSQDTAGDEQDFIRSVSGRANATNLNCNLSATEGVRDLAAGAPSVEVFLDVVEDTGAVDNNVLANATPESRLEDVFRETDIRMVFDDIMNPATVVNPVSGLSSLIEVAIDQDGDASDPSDQVELPGTFSISLDQDELRTIVTFVPTAGLPSGVSNTGERLLVVKLPPGVVDLGGNQLTNGGEVVAVPEEIIFTPQRLPAGGENFSTATALLILQIPYCFLPIFQR